MTDQLKTQTITLGLGKVTISLDVNDRVIDYATGELLKPITKSPEEPVRQYYEHILIDELGYLPGQIGIEVTIQMGVESKRADIVVYEDIQKVKKKLIVETKKPIKKDGITQLQSYLDATGTEFGVWTNGDDKSYWYHGSPQSYEPLGKVPSVSETVDDISNTKLREDLEPAKDLVTDFKAAEQFILTEQGGVDVFDEIFKLIFAKIFDEKKHLKTMKSEAQFRAGVKEPASRVRERVVQLFDGAKRLYSDVFSERDEIKLSGATVKWVVLLLQNYILSETDMDILGIGFEVLVNPKMKSDKGQYFTPRQVVRTAVEMLQIDENMKIVDPACGSGGFLIYSMERVWKKIENEWASPLDALAEKLTFAKTMVYGTDYDDRLAKVAKAYMAIWGDGRAHIYAVPCGIKSYQWQGEVTEHVIDGTFDAVLTNPPFAGDLSLLNIAHHFDLGRKNGVDLASQRKDILFIERALNLVRPAKEEEKSGLIAIVLPKGDLDEREKQYVRDYILDHAKILAVISLHKFTFVPFTSQKTSLLILKRMLPEDIPADYDIYMAVSEKPSKDKSGNSIYVHENGEVKLDEYNRPELDTDLFDIAKEFVNKTPNIGFWVKKSQLVGRLNAEYYSPVYMDVRNKVTQHSYIKLGEILLPEIGMVNGKDLSALSEDGKRKYSDVGIPYLRVGDVLENEINSDDAEKINPTDYDLSNIPDLVTGDLLVTRKGSTGRVAVVTNDDINVILSSEIIRLRIKNDITLQNGSQYHINSYYLAAYLNSFIGKKLIMQKQTGGISEGINQPDLKEIEIYLPSQEKMDEIATAYQQSNQSLKESKKYIRLVSNQIYNLL